MGSTTTAIFAFSEVARQKPEAFLASASGGNELEEMKDLAARNIPPNRYEFVGFVPEESTRQFYSELDLFLFPSRYGFGMSAVEAMTCGTPAITGRTLDSTDFFTTNFRWWTRTLPRNWPRGYRWFSPTGSIMLSCGNGR
ncbi:glycosyltransferase [Bradyrhizobium manausense]|uniref:Glycosyl transferase family 1 domain-containing protein n=1 Tax=Bradyrhizobium manausense TaxID=989370 RepID=A0A0R3DJV9_9BRAD|nr:glycosyltransferase [Bradyrhizobium manausense]KRQ10131.1 hypothetical protein AOQ71_19350 [Bradyrhizobium manausense]